MTQWHTVNLRKPNVQIQNNAENWTQRCSISRQRFGDKTSEDQTRSTSLDCFVQFRVITNYIKRSGLVKTFIFWTFGLSNRSKSGKKVTCPKFEHIWFVKQVKMWEKSDLSEIRTHLVCQTGQKVGKKWPVRNLNTFGCWL